MSTMTPLSPPTFFRFMSARQLGHSSDECRAKAPPLLHGVTWCGECGHKRVV
jgi:hypothetical protein